MTHIEIDITESYRYVVGNTVVFVQNLSNATWLKRSMFSSFQLEQELEVCEKESGELQEYANSVLQQIADYCPDILEQVVNALEESC